MPDELGLRSEGCNSLFHSPAGSVSPVHTAVQRLSPRLYISEANGRKQLDDFDFPS